MIKASKLNENVKVSYVVLECWIGWSMAIVRCSTSWIFLCYFRVKVFKGKRPMCVLPLSVSIFLYLKNL